VHAEPSDPHITPVHGPGLPPPLTIRADSLGPTYSGRRITLNGVTGTFQGVKLLKTVKIRYDGHGATENWPVAIVDEGPGLRHDVSFTPGDIVTLH
jgi:hypothetical protein